MSLSNKANPAPAGFRLLAVLSLAALLVVAGCGGDASDASAQASDPTLVHRAPVSVIELAPRDLSRPLNLSAPVQPRLPVRISSRTSATVGRLHAEVGDTVEEGELLAELDIDEQRAELARARARAREARSGFERAQQMRERQLLSEADFQAAQAQLAAAEGEQRIWRTRVEFGRVTAPTRATVTARHVEQGEAVDAQQMLFELADLDDLVLHLSVSELDVVHLSPEDALLVRFDALPLLELEGSVRRVFPAADLDSRQVTVEVSLPADAFERGVRPGFLARVSTRIDQREGVLALPSAAIGQDDGERYVFVVEGDVLRRQVVAIGPTRGDWTEVTHGLQAGERVLAGNPGDMREGQSVRVIRTLEDR